MKNIRINEYTTFFYRLFLTYFFYFISRLLFVIFNSDTVKDLTFSQVSKLFYFGIQFDTTAILYTNLLFILLSIAPTLLNTTKIYQKILFYIYFITNSIAISTNFVDFVYYPFSKSRLTTASTAIVEHETNKFSLFITFISMYWYVLLLFILTIALWVYLYKKVKIKQVSITSKFAYFSTSVLAFVALGIATLAGIRGGDLSTSTRPINMLDANRHVSKAEHSDVILNTPFCIIRTIGKSNVFKEFNFVSQDYISQNVKPIKEYHRDINTKPNIVFFILESFGREYIGTMNKDRNIAGYKSYTPFLDSLSSHSQVFWNAYANGRQSIHAMSSNLAGVPTFQVAYTSSPFVKQPTQSIVSICKEMGYDTSFFHSAPNGSMGFLGFANILGFDHYYGKTEYNNDNDYDGIWGIWDEPFMQFMNKTLSQKQTPFLGTIFTVSSHHPFKVPAQYEGKFDKGTLPIHQCITYSDNAIRKFFQSAKKEKWYQNTIFVFVADHPNMSYYPEYKTQIGSAGVPIMFFSPNPSLVGVGRSGDLAQQIDIYPSLVHLIGYNKPFRSWGRSLFSNSEQPQAYVTSHAYYQLVRGNYVYILNNDGSLNGVYLFSDSYLKNNLMSQQSNPEIKKGITDLKAFLQDYMHTIINKRLSGSK